jgi:cupin 2 domain-containing protein
LSRVDEAHSAVIHREALLHILELVEGATLFHPTKTCFIIGISNATWNMRGMIENLLSGFPTDAPKEQVAELLSRPNLRIERIVSTGQSSPPDFWYDQPDAEWVLVLQGEALLRFEDEDDARRLKAGDFVEIAAHRRHRVDWTDPTQPTIWLAVHYSA